jgi:hypothetical protein
MKTRSAILTLAALATLAISALAPTQASAWSMRGGFGGGHGGVLGSRGYHADDSYSRCHRFGYCYHY